MTTNLTKGDINLTGASRGAPAGRDFSATCSMDAGNRSGTAKKVQFTWTFFVDLVMPTRSCRSSCSSCMCPCHGTLWTGWLEILPSKIQEMPALGQKLLSQHSYTVTTNTFFMRTCTSVFSNLLAKNKSLKHTIFSVLFLEQDKNQHRLVLISLIMKHRSLMKIQAQLGYFWVLAKAFFCSMRRHENVTSSKTRK